MANVQPPLRLGLRGLLKSAPGIRAAILLPIPIAVAAGVLPVFFRWAGAEFSHCSSSGSGWRCSASTLLALAALVFLSRITSWMFTEIAGLMSVSVLYRKVVSHLGRTQLKVFRSTHSGDLLNLLMGDFKQVRLPLIVAIGDTLNAAIELIINIALIAFIGPRYLLAGLPAGLCFLWIQRHFGKVLKHAQSLSAAAFAKVVGASEELVEGGVVARLYHSEPYFLRRAQKRVASSSGGHVLIGKVNSWGTFWLGLVSESFTAVILVGIFMALRHGHISQELAGIIVAGMLGFFVGLGQLTYSYTRLVQFTANSDRILKLFELPLEEQTGSQTQVNSTGVGDIRFENFSMSYEPDGPLALEGVTLEIPTGTVTAILGKTGSGKTSLIEALYRTSFRRNGDIKIAGDSIFSLPLDLHRSRMRIITQEPFLFSGTVRENISPTLTDAETIRRALSDVGLDRNADERIEPHRGSLSQGEAQLLSLARALVSPQDILIFDEVTSNMDQTYERLFTQSVRKWFKGRCVIVISHRKETLAMADLLIEISNGKVLRQLKPADMLKGT